MKKVIPLIKTLGLLSGFGAAIAVAANVKEEVVGPVAENAKYVVSPRGVHLAAAAAKGSRVNVVVDGVAGPRFDQIAEDILPYIDPRPYQGMDVNSVPRAASVTFSKDGRRYAYLARLGQEWVLTADNKEVLRLPVADSNGSATTDFRLEFTGEGGTHLLFARGSFYGYEMWVDGRKWPGFFGSGGGGTDGTIDPIVSADGQHIAYVAQMSREKSALIVDGKDAGYFGKHLQFTPDSKHLICVNESPKGQSVLIDGKPVFTARQILRVFVPPVGNRLIFSLMHFSKDGLSAEGSFLMVDGKPVEATLTKSPTPPKVIFSPDGKRYAAVCGSNPNMFVVIDGKKGQEYSNIDPLGTVGSPIAFSADSSKVVYTASTIGSGYKAFVVTNEEESDAFNMGVKFWFSPDGKRLAYAGTVDQGNQKWRLVIDGKVQPVEPGWNVQEFAFSPDGSRYAYESSSGGNKSVVLDGKPTGLAGKFAFSPDSKHIAVWGTRPPPDAKNAGVLGQFQTALEQGLFVDGQHVWGDYDHMNLRYFGFMGEGDHLFWTTQEPVTGAHAAPGLYESVAYVDGVQVARCDRTDSGTFAMIANPRGNVQFAKAHSAWNVGSSGLTFLGPVGDSIKRFTVIPPSDTSVKTMIAEAAEAPRRAAAKAAEEKKKADEAKAAKKAKADAAAAEKAAKAKADYDARVAANLKARADAQAKAKADYEARVAKQKADYEALMAKRKADAEAADAARKKK